MRLTAIGIAGTLLFTAACSPVRPVPVEVRVPVPVPCLDPADVPQVVPTAADQLQAEDSPGVKIKAVLIERERLRKTDSVFRALVQGCLVNQVP